MDPIAIEGGLIRGAVFGNEGQEVSVYRGIPYAAPPLGEFRWRPPQPVVPWSGIRECSVFSATAPQRLKLEFPRPPVFASEPALSEDCLYLNVQTPAKKDAPNLPVMVWMHGGAYDSDSGNNQIYNNIKLTQHGVVLVTVNMRLGSLGLLAHPSLSRESPYRVSGNYLFLDMIASLKWVKRNISVFGGDPGNVTIFGESGGGAKVSCLIASPLANGLFQRAICESGVSSGTPGGFSPSRALKDLESIGGKFFNMLGLDGEIDTLHKARAIPWEKLIEAESSLIKHLNIDGPGIWDAAVDNWFLSDTPAKVFQKGQPNAVSLITCANLGELTGPGPIVLPFLIPDYVNMLSGINKVGRKAYACIFDQVPMGWRKQGVVSTHLMELNYIFGNMDIPKNWNMLLFLSSTLGEKLKLPEVDDIDRDVSEEMMTLWTQFAKTGNPSVAGLITWPSWEERTDQYLYIANSLKVKTGFSRLIDNN